MKVSRRIKLIARRVRKYLDFAAKSTCLTSRLPFQWMGIEQLEQRTLLNGLSIAFSEPTILESRGTLAGSVTITRDGDVSRGLVVILSSSDEATLHVDPIVSFNPTQTSVTVPLEAVKDAIVDGTQSVTITATAKWTFEFIDVAGNVGVRPALALDAMGYPRIAYQDGGNDELKYASFDGVDWLVESVIVDTNEIIGSTSLDLDSLGNPHIAYANNRDGEAIYAHHDGTSWTVEATVADSSDFYVSLAVNSSDLPSIAAIVDRTDELKLLEFDGSNWTGSAIDNPLTVARYASMKLDGNDNPIIAYVNATRDEIRLAKRIDGVWQHEVVGTGFSLHGTVLKLDDLGRPHVAYVENHPNNSNLDTIHYAHFDGASWNTEFVTTQNFIGPDMSLALTSEGLGRIAFSDSSNSYFAMSDGVNWDVELIALRGVNPSLALNANGDPFVAMRNNASRSLMIAERADEFVSDVIFVTDDDAALFEFTRPEYVFAESGGTLEVYLSLDTPLDIPVVFDVDFSDVTASGSGVDYDSTPRQFSYEAGESGFRRMTVPILLDAELESPETFSISLSLASEIGDRVVNLAQPATVTISDAGFTADTEVLYSLAPHSPSTASPPMQLFAVDTVTGAWAAIGETGTNRLQSLTPGANGFLLSNYGDRLFDIDLDSGAASQFGTLITPGGYGGLARQPGTNVVYVAMAGPTTGSPEGLFKTDLDTGESTFVGEFGFLEDRHVTGAAFDAEGVLHILHFRGTFQISTVDLATGLATLAFDTGITNNGTARGGLTFSEDGVGYLNNSNVLYSFDLLNQQVELIGHNEVTSTSALSIARGRSVFVSESGTTDTFWVVLDVQPASDVVFDLTLVDSEESFIDQTSLTFTSSNWNVPQIVSVTGLDDEVIDGSQTNEIRVSINQLASDDFFDSVPDQIIRVTTVDDDEPIFTTTDVTVAEDAAVAQIEVLLNKPFESDVTFRLRSFDGTATGGGIDYTSFFSMLGLLNAGDTRFVLDIPIQNDNLVEGDEQFSVTVEAFDQSDSALIPQPLTSNVSILDDDQSIVSVVALNDGNEAGPVDGSFTVSLSKPSATSTTVHFSVSGSASPGIDHGATSGEITFVAGQQIATISVPVIDDTTAEGLETVVVTLDQIVSASNANITIDPLAASAAIGILDDDASGFVVIETDDQTTVSESGLTDEILVVLSRQPDSNVVIDIGIDSASGLSVDKETLTFTSINWDQPQVVTVSGADNDLVNGHVISSVVVSVDEPNSDDTFVGLDDVTIAVTITDDDLATFSIGDATANEDEGTIAFSLSLDSPIDIDVTVSVMFGAGTATGGGVDYTSTTQQFVFDAGTTGSQIVSVPINDDNLFENLETFEAFMNTTTPIGTRMLDLSDRAVGSIVDDDSAGPRVVSTTIQPGDVVPTGDLAIEIQFDKAIDPASVIAFSAVLVRSGVAKTPTVSDLDASGTVLSLFYSNVVDAGYIFQIRGDGPDAVMDLAGNRLDGEVNAFPLPPNQSGDGIPGGDFSIVFSSDTQGPMAIDVFNRSSPMGSLIATIDTFDLRGQAGIHGPSDIDTFEVFVEAGEMFSLFVFPFSGTPVFTVSAAGLQSTGGVPYLTVPAASLPGDGGFVPITVQADIATEYIVFVQRNGLLELPEDEATLTSPIDISRIDLPNETGRWAATVDMGARPSPLANLTLDLTGKVGRSLDIIVSTSASSDLTGAQLELIAPDGSVIAQVLGGSTAQADNFDLGLLDVLVPADGVYTIRATGASLGLFNMLVTDGLAFETEMPVEISRQLDGFAGGLGYLESSSDVDSYTLTLVSGERFELSTFTPFDDPRHSPLNDLDAKISLFDPNGNLIAMADGEQSDGRNAKLIVDASSDGVYRIDVQSMNGAGEYIVFSQAYVPPVVQAISINDSDPQRSMVMSIAYQFSEPITIQGNALSVLNQSDSSVIDPGLFSVNYDANTNVATWSFSGLVGGSLADGNFLATLSANAILDENGNSLDGDVVQDLHRLFGDGDGDRDVDNLDLFTFRTAFNTGSSHPNYDSRYDIANDGDIDNADLFAFRSRLFTRLDPHVSTAQGSSGQQALLSQQSQQLFNEPLTTIETKPTTNTSAPPITTENTGIRTDQVPTIDPVVTPINTLLLAASQAMPTNQAVRSSDRSTVFNRPWLLASLPEDRHAGTTLLAAWLIGE